MPSALGAMTMKRIFTGKDPIAKSFKKQRQALRSANGTAGRYTNNVVTTQNDVKTIKRGRKTNKRKLVKQKNFRNKIEKALAPRNTHHTYTEIESTPAIINTIIAVRGVVTYQYTSDPNNSEVTTINHGANNPQGVTYIKDQLHNLGGQTSVVNVGAQASTSGPDFRELTVLSSHLDLSLSNPTTSLIPLLYDVYWCVATSTQSQVTHATPMSSWNYCLSINNTLTVNSGTKSDSTFNGITPSDAPGFGKYWKVLKCQRIYLQPGATSDMSFSAGGYKYTPQKFDGQHTIAGITKGVMIVAAIGDNTGMPSAAGQAILRYHTTRRYRVMYPLGKDQIPSLPTNTTRFT